MNVIIAEQKETGMENVLIVSLKRDLPQFPKEGTNE